MKHSFAIAASVFAATTFVTCLASAQTPVSPDQRLDKLDCKGINACKGQSACKSATNSCKGQNSCKGKGWVHVASTLDCVARGGAPGGG